MGDRADQKKGVQRSFVTWRRGDLDEEGNGGHGRLVTPSPGD
jgi:hypothetical protein